MSKRTTTKSSERKRARTPDLDQTPLLPDAEWPEVEHQPVVGDRSLLTPLRVGLICLLIAIVGFIGGVQVQKSRGGGGEASPFPAGGLPDFASGELPAGLTGGGDATVGTVASVDGKTIYVTDADGNTIKVLSGAAGTTITRSSEAKPGDIHPGDTVVVQGASRKNGSVKAKSITASAAGTAAGPDGGTAATQSGSSSSAAGGADPVDQLFGQ